MKPYTDLEIEKFKKDYNDPNLTTEFKEWEEDGEAYYTRKIITNKAVILGTNYPLEKNKLTK